MSLPQSKPAFIEEKPIGVIIGREPSWLVRSGISMIGIVLAIIFILAYVIQYPDTLDARIKITPELPPAELVAKVTGRIQEIYIEDGKAVVSGQKLILLENDVNQSELAYLEESLNRLSNMNLDTVNQYPVNHLSQLGELQNYFNQWRESLNQIYLSQSSLELQEQIKRLEQLVIENTSLNTRLEDKKKTWSEIISNKNLELSNMRALREKKLAAATETLELENELLNQQITLNDLEIEIQQNQLLITDYQYQINLLTAQFRDKEAALLGTANTKLASLQAAIATWKTKYIVSAPYKGTVSFSSSLFSNKQVEAGQALINVISPASKMSGEMVLGHSGAGKLDLGQQVEIELDSFPYAEFGKLVGEVHAIALIPTTEGYLVTVTLCHDMITTSGTPIPFIPNLLGNAKIITQKRTIIDRIFGTIISLLRDSQ